MSTTPDIPDSQASLNTSDAFRGHLANEVPLWEARGLITPEAAAALRLEYRLDAVGRESSQLFSKVILGLGGLLIGGGILAFVAANWEALPTAGKIVLLFATLLGLHGAGFWFWQKRDQERLGKALILAGNLAFGASIGLMAQIFHIQGDTYRGVGAWALGALAMAWAVRSDGSALLALLTGCIWYFGFVEAFPRNGIPILLPPVMPILFGAAFLPLAVLTSSAWLFGFGLLAAMILAVFAGALGETLASVVFTTLATGLVVWAAGLTLSRREGMQWCGAISRRFGWLALSFQAWLLAFREFWRHTHDPRSLSGWPLLALAAFLVAGKLLHDHLSGLPRESEDRIMYGGVLGAVLLLGCSGMMVGGGALPVIFVNLAGLLLAASEMRRGMSEASRSSFWAGALLAFLLIAARFLEYETSLLFKSLAFLSCGALMIFGGTRYEAWLKTREVRP